MAYPSILAKTTTDKIKSRVLSPDVCELVLEVYMPAEEFGKFIKKNFDKEFYIEIKDKDIQDTGYTCSRCNNWCVGWHECKKE